MTPVRLPRLFGKIVLALCLFAAPLTSSSLPVQAPVGGETPLAGMHPEVRLRKLHLVRPDLIPYPIAFEVCC
jgi:hypothetical protein